MLRAWLQTQRAAARALYLQADHANVEEYNRGRRDAFDEVLAALDPGDDHTPTQRLPPITDTIGPRRRPPAPVVQELSERVELLRALVQELADYDGADQ